MHILASTSTGFRIGSVPGKRKVRSATHNPLPDSIRLAADLATALAFDDAGHELAHVVEFVKFLNQLEKEVPPDLEIHLIMDNYATHKSAAVQRWLKPKKRRRFHLHFTSTSGSWLNQVERFFGLITDKMIRRGTFNQKPKPFEWKGTADVIPDKVRRCEEAIVKN